MTFDAATKQLVWTGTLGHGGHATITYSVTIHGSAGGLVSNRVVGSPGSSCASPSPPELPCVTDTPIVRPPAPGADLALTKTASSATAHPGGQVSFVLAVRNQGPGRGDRGDGAGSGGVGVVFAVGAAEPGDVHDSPVSWCAGWDRWSAAVRRWCR